MFKNLKKEFREEFGFYKEMDSVPGSFGLFSAAGLFFSWALFLGIINKYLIEIIWFRPIFFIGYLFIFLLSYGVLKTSTSKKNIFRKSFFVINVLVLVLFLIVYILSFLIKF